MSEFSVLMPQVVTLPTPALQLFITWLGDAPGSLCLKR
jgi:hypothetical protein